MQGQGLLYVPSSAADAPGQGDESSVAAAASTSASDLASAAKGTKYTRHNVATLMQALQNNPLAGPPLQVAQVNSIFVLSVVALLQSSDLRHMRY